MRMRLIVIDLVSLIQRSTIDARLTGSRRALRKSAPVVTIVLQCAPNDERIKDDLAMLFQPCCLG